MNADNPQPLEPFNPGDTQPMKPVRKTPRWRSVLFSVLGVIALLLLASFGGYAGGLDQRKAALSGIISRQLMDQFQLALVDEHFGHYEAARERLEFIIQNDPAFPGAQAELAKVFVQLTIPTPSPTPPPTSTPDIRGEQSLFATAQQLIAAGDWPNALTALDQLRKQDPKFNTSQVDGMYYFALRNYGVYLIQQQGDLEGGSYELDLAEHFCPRCLDNTAYGLRDGARAYVLAVSYFGVNWARSVQLFRDVAGGWPSMWDGNMNAAQRFKIALVRYGDQLWAQGQACNAWEQYQEAEGYGDLDPGSAKNANQANQQCNPEPTEVPTEAATEPPTAGPPPTP